jgi:hypothetical protein
MTLDAILFPIGLKAYYQIPTFALKNQMPRKKGQKLIPTKREGIFSTFFTNYPISWALNSPSPWPIHSSSSVLPAKAIASSPTGLLHPHPFCLIQKLHFQLATQQEGPMGFIRLAGCFCIAAGGLPNEQIHSFPPFLPFWAAKIAEIARPDADFLQNDGISRFAEMPKWLVEAASQHGLQMGRK